MILNYKMMIIKELIQLKYNYFYFLISNLFNLNYQFIKAKADFIARVEAYQRRYQTIEDDEDHSQIRFFKKKILFFSLNFF